MYACIFEKPVITTLSPTLTAPRNRKDCTTEMDVTYYVALPFVVSGNA